MKTPAAIMYNILGEDEGEPGFHLANELIGRALNLPGTTVQWYDKSEMQKQRKMGHITIVGPALGIVEARLNTMLKNEGSDSQSTAAPLGGIIMGSDSYLSVMKNAARILNMFDVPYEVRIVLAHQTPQLKFTYASSARERGGSDRYCWCCPLLFVSLLGSSLDGMDSLLSIVKIQKGVPVATVAINNSTNAGLLVVRIFGVGDSDLLNEPVSSGHQG